MTGYFCTKKRSQRALSIALGLASGIAGSLLLWPRPASAEPEELTWARVDFLRNQVQLFPQSEPARRARISDILGIGDAIRTARQSRAELRFNDGSLARIGERATFRFTPNTRNFQLTNGTALLLIPPARGRSTVQTPNAVTGIQGSALFVRYIPETDTTIVGALTNNPDGPMILFNRDGTEQQALRANQIGVIQGDRITDLYEFDGALFWQSSSLADGFNYQQESSNGEDALDGVRQEIREAISSQEPLEGDEIIENPASFSRPEPPAEENTGENTGETGNSPSAPTQASDNQSSQSPPPADSASSNSSPDASSGSQTSNPQTEASPANSNSSAAGNPISDSQSEETVTPAASPPAVPTNSPVEPSVAQENEALEFEDSEEQPLEFEGSPAQQYLSEDPKLSNGSNSSSSSNEASGTPPATAGNGRDSSNPSTTTTSDRAPNGSTPTPGGTTNGTRTGSPSSPPAATNGNSPTPPGSNAAVGDDDLPTPVENPSRLPVTNDPANRPVNNTPAERPTTTQPANPRPAALTAPEEGGSQQNPGQNSGGNPPQNQPANSNTPPSNSSGGTGTEGSPSPSTPGNPPASGPSDTESNPNPNSGSSGSEPGSTPSEGNPALGNGSGGTPSEAPPQTQPETPEETPDNSNGVGDSTPATLETAPELLLEEGENADGEVEVEVPATPEPTTNTGTPEEPVNQPVTAPSTDIENPENPPETSQEIPAPSAVDPSPTLETSPVEEQIPTKLPLSESAPEVPITPAEVDNNSQVSDPLPNGELLIDSAADPPGVGNSNPTETIPDTFDSETSTIEDLRPPLPESVEQADDRPPMDNNEMNGGNRPNQESGPPGSGTNNSPPVSPGGPPESSVEQPTEQSPTEQSPTEQPVEEAPPLL